MQQAKNCLLCCCSCRQRQVKVKQLLVKTVTACAFGSGLPAFQGKQCTMEICRSQSKYRWLCLSCHVHLCVDGPRSAWITDSMQVSNSSACDAFCRGVMSGTLRHTFFTHWQAQSVLDCALRRACVTAAAELILSGL